MWTVYLLRHCEYEAIPPILPGRLPVQLSMKGVERANHLSRYFRSQNIKKIYSSAVFRCKQTAEIISDGTIPIAYDKHLLETLSAYQGYWEPNWDGKAYHFYSHIEELGGESDQDIFHRVSGFWNNIFPSLDGNTIICSHGDPLLMLYSFIRSFPLPNLNESEDLIPGWLLPGEFHEFKCRHHDIEYIGKITENDIGFNW